MEVVPEVFAWVKARSECSLEAVFWRLCEVVDSDMKAAKDIRLLRPTYKTEVNKISSAKFLACVTWDYGGIPQFEGVAFELKDGAIEVRHTAPQEKDTVLFSALATVCPDGKCRLVVKGQEKPLELWQISKLALESVLFGG